MPKTKQKPVKKNPLSKRDTILPVVKKPVYFNDCYWCDAAHIYYPDLSSAAIKRICLKCRAESQAPIGPTCMCAYWTNVRGRSIEDAKKICLKCSPITERPVYRPVPPPPVFDLNALIASTPFPRFRTGTDANGIASGQWEGDRPESSQNGPSFPQTAPQSRNPLPPIPERKGSPVLSERKAMPLPTVASKPDPAVARAGSLPIVERDGKKPKIVLCGQRFGLSYVFLWMGSAGWSHDELESWCDKLEIDVPSINTTQSRLRAGRNKDSESYGEIPKMSKKQEEMMSLTIKRRK